jgi:hypothetical protein
MALLSDTGYRYATAPENDPDAICPAFERKLTSLSNFLMDFSKISGFD